MACYHPIPAYQSEVGARVILYPPAGPRGDPSNLELPCGKCLGCRQAHATTWAHRCEDEARLWQHNSFLTLTYNERFLPSEGQLNGRHLQLFIKRLRKRLHSILAGPEEKRPEGYEPGSILSDPRSSIRYFACGEYGEQDGRPHYHALIFNGDFLDGTRVGYSAGNPLRSSDTISYCWSDPKTKEPYGFHTVGTALPGAVAGYIAKYALKQQSRAARGLVDPDGVWKPAPFLRMSLRPALGKRWLDHYHADLSRGYTVDNRGTKSSIPRYYKNKLKEEHKDTAALLEYYQHLYLLNNTGDKNTEARRRDAEIIHKQKYDNSKRR